MMRRQILKAAPLLPLPVFMPAADDSGLTKILRLFHERQQIREAANSHVAAFEIEDEELERLFFHRTDRLEAEIMALPSTCAADFAAKMIVAHCDGEFSCLSWDDPVWLEARRLVGA